LKNQRFSLTQKAKSVKANFGFKEMPNTNVNAQTATYQFVKKINSIGILVVINAMLDET